MCIFLIVLIIGYIGVFVWRTPLKAQSKSEAATPASQSKSRQEQIMKNISPTEAYELIQQHGTNESFVILDVRTPKEFKAGRIENSINLDYYAKTFQQDLDTLDKEKTYLVYCRSGNRSGRTLSIMKKLNFQEAYNMAGGIGGWNSQKFPLVR